MGLEGLLPPRQETVGEQLLRVDAIFAGFHTDLERHVFLRALQDTNEVLFFRFLQDRFGEAMPVVYTPTVGEACQHFSRIYRKPQGLFLSFEHRHRMAEAIDSAPEPIDVIVATDGERILGLGDQGLGGMAIPIGKLALYSVLAGIDPGRTLPVLLDVGTNNPSLRGDPLYLGSRHPRVRGAEYYEFVAQFVALAKRRWPGVLLQWEDFAQHHAAELLRQHRTAVLSFNDDIQGTAAVALAAVQSARRTLGLSLPDARVVVVGAGSAGTGIAGMLLESGVSADRLLMVDSDGVLHDRREMARHQVRFAQPFEAVRRWAGSGEPVLRRLVGDVQPDVLIGVTGQPGLFSRGVVRGMADAVERPVILPLSNPTSRCEATPADLLKWTDGRALVATGSPFKDVTYEGRRHQISQANNVYVFPGLGLGALVARARQITDGMLRSAADALVAECPHGASAGSWTGLLPPLERVARLSGRIALAVARRAREDGVGDPISDAEIANRIAQRRWTPDYPQIMPAGERSTAATGRYQELS